ncbi:MAG TPA: carbohydrate ABC transporter permease [Clostridiales bacterium]|nr:carbohydrate ABC transporter permease [Clostridiales bacterium]
MQNIDVRKIRARKFSLRRITFGKVIFYLIMTGLACFMALPLVYLVVTAFKPLDELFLFPPRFFVKNPTLQNFTDLMATLDSNTVPFTRYLFNSTLVTVVSVFGSVVTCTMAAFVAEKLKPRGLQAFSRIVTYALMFSAPAAQIPIYLIVSNLGMINTYWSLIIPKIAVPMYFFLYQQFVSQIPNELIESARIDGCGNMKLFIRIIVPLTKAAISTIVVFAFVANWNDSFSPMIYIQKQAMKTLPIILSTIGTGGVARAGAGAAAVFLTTLPTIGLYVAMQTRVLTTMAYSGIKG